MASPTIAIILLALILVIIECTPTPPSKNDQEAFEKECAAQFKLSIDDVPKILETDTDIPVSENMMCFDKCVFEKMGILADDGTINDSVAVEAFSMVPEEAANFSKALIKCKPLNEGKNTCSAVHKVFQCIVKELQKPL